jgi:hypothetical protein
MKGTLILHLIERHSVAAAVIAAWRSCWWRCGWRAFAVWPTASSNRRFGTISTLACPSWRRSLKLPHALAEVEDARDAANRAYERFSKSARTD